MKPIIGTGIVTIFLILIHTVSGQFLDGTKFQAPTITAQQILAFKADVNLQGQYLIVDVRDKAETDVSIIPGAITKAEFEKIKSFHQDKAIFVYCTVGYRSGIYANQLMKDGWNSFNYQGSILDWCNHQMPVVTPDGHDTKRVHTYSSNYALAAGYQAVY